jgi:hypothetical protein
MQRESKSAEGMMLQTDASPHDWLEGRAPEMDLLGVFSERAKRNLTLGWLLLLTPVFRPVSGSQRLYVQ